MTNKKQGNAFEREFCEKLAGYGFWVLNVPQNAAGQPADVIAVRNRKAYIVDCKDCAKSKFPFSRIEENQQYAMMRWQECRNGSGFFALKCEDRVFMISLPTLKWLQISLGKTALNYEDIRSNGIPLEEWVKDA